jgi:hypothetical protein
VAVEAVVDDNDREISNLTGKGFIMRKSVLFLVLTALIGSAQAVTVDDQIAMVRQMAATERQAIVTANMDLTESESEHFWPLYRQYRAEMITLGDRKIALIKDYASHHETMTDDKAREIIEESFEIEGERLQIRQQYARKFRKILPEIKVARLLQIENKVDTVYALQLSAEIPLFK